MEQKNSSSPNITEIIFVSGMPDKVGWIIMRDGLCIVSSTAKKILKEVQTNHD